MDPFRYGPISDNYETKEIDDPVNRLRKLKPVRYTYKCEQQDEWIDGFLAHEVQEIVPEAVQGEKDAIDDEGNPVYQKVYYSQLIPLLTAATQNAIEKLEELTRKVDEHRSASTAD